MSQENIEIVRGVLQAVAAGAERGDPGAGFDSEAVAENVEWVPTPSFLVQSSFHGRDGFSEFMRTWTEGFTDWSFTVERLIEAPDDRVVVLLHQWAIGQGSGARVEQDLGQVYELTDGRVIRISNFLHLDQALEAARVAE